MLDPRTSDDAAKKWTLELFQWMAYVERESGLWYEALVEQISMGMVSCDAVTNYNQQAERLYYWSAWIWDTFDPLWQGLRQAGMNIPADPPLPRLIGTTYKVYGSRRQTTKFAVTVPCAAGTLAPAGQLDPSGLPDNCNKWEVDPGAQPPAPGTVWSGTGMLDLAGAELGATLGELVFGAIVVVGAVYIVHQLGGTTRAVAGAIDGSTIAQINAQMASRQIEQDRKRAEFITKCQRDTIARMGTLGTQLTLEQQNAIRKACEDGAATAYPDRKPPYARSIGLAGVLLAMSVVGGAVGVVYLVTRRGRGGLDGAAPPVVRSRRRLTR